MIHLLGKLLGSLLGKLFNIQCNLIRMRGGIIIINVVEDSRNEFKVKLLHDLEDLLEASTSPRKSDCLLQKKKFERLMNEVGKKYNERNLWNAMRSKLCWSNYRVVLSLKGVHEIRYYLNECENKNLTQDS